MGGSSSVTPGLGAAHVPITCYVKWPARQYLIWDTVDFEIPIVRAELTATQVRTSLGRFAKMLNAYDDLAAGFVKASSILVMGVARWKDEKAPQKEKKTGDDDESELSDFSEWLALKTDAASETESKLYKRAKVLKEAQEKLMNDLCNEFKLTRKELEAMIDQESDDESGLSTTHFRQVLIRASTSRAALDLQSEQMGSALENRGAKKGGVASGSKSGSKKEAEEAPVQFKRALVHAMLECGTIQVQTPRGYNFLWEVMQIPKPESTVNQMLTQDGKCLIGMHADDQMRAMVCIGGMLSIAAGSVFHGINITGRELNLWAGSGGGKSSDLLSGLCLATNKGTVAPYYQTVVGVFQQMFHMNLSPVFLRNMGVFSGAGKQMPGITQRRSWWKALWPNRIPYLIEPASMSWAMKGWNDAWGLFAPNPRVNFSHDIVRGGYNDNEYIAFHRDEPAYLAYAATRKPYMNIAYGNMAINVARQIVAPRARWELTIRLIRLAAVGSTEVDPPRVDIWQPEYNPVTGMILIGSLPTYDWKRGAVIAPGLDREKIGTTAFTQLVHVNRVVAGVGLIHDGYVQTRGDNQGITGADVIGDIEGLDVDTSVLQPYSLASGSGN
nr:MAG: capsid protein [Lestijarvi totivirus]